MCFVPVDPSGATGEDLARGRPVEAPGTWDGDYAPAETVVGQRERERDTNQDIRDRERTEKVNQ